MNRKTTSLALFFTLFMSLYCLAQNTISGVVTDGEKVLEGVSIVVAQKTTGTTTDSNGKYTITASPKDILVFSYVGMESIEIIVEDVTTSLNIVLLPDVEALEEVVVTKYKKKTQKDLARTFYSDPTVINSGVGYLSPDAVGYELRVVDGKDLNNKAFDILAAIAYALPGITIRTRKGERYLFTDNYGSLRGATPAAYEIDGVFRGASPTVPVEVDISSVLRVGIIPANQAIRLYGPKEGAGGVVVINTDRIVYGEREEGNRPYDQAKLRNNIYANDALSKVEMRKNQPVYLRELYASSGEEEALEIYQKHKVNFGHSYVFALEAYRFFLERFGDDSITQQIIEENELLFYQNPIALKALAYVYQGNGEATKANELYKALFLIRPDYGQSYLDLAGSYREVGAYKKAASLYTRYKHLMSRKLVEKDSNQFSQILDREFQNLIALSGKEIISDKTIENQVLKQDFFGTRLVFEWNDGEAEFEIQFVNPRGNYQIVEHSMVADAVQIQREKTIGYSCQEFLMDESLPGQWQINVKYLGNRKLSASYLKASVFYNYGLDTQRKETKVIKLSLKNVNQEWFTLNIAPFLQTK